ncbi:rhomboid family intramembrane serine protease [Flavobacterium sp.]|uniref:rhomboid family intramembrane serine protease n=1 Tax=Flavobacterium sp. TaxID=239 RepID=UPI00263A164A|nr:rhomboid family intramembrane serine protease [Flavobacterium sp.]
MMNITPVVKQLLIINIIFFIGSQLVPVAESYFALYYFENPMFKVWQPLSHMFMHGGIAHIFFNMFALYSFGSALEHFWGGNKFLFFYISCGLGAALLHSFINYLEFRNELSYLLDSGFKKEDVLSLLNQNMFDQRWLNVIGQDGVDALSISYHVPAVGASGAVYGLLVAFAFMFPNAELALMFIPIPIKAKYFVPGLLAIDLFLGFKGSSIFGAGSTGIAHFAHIGGALTGFIMMWYWKKNQFNHKRWN